MLAFRGLITPGRGVTWVRSSIFEFLHSLKFLWYGRRYNHQVLCTGWPEKYYSCLAVTNVWAWSRILDNLIFWQICVNISKKAQYVQYAIYGAMKDKSSQISTVNSLICNRYALLTKYSESTGVS